MTSIQKIIPAKITVARITITRIIFAVLFTLGLNACSSKEKDKETVATPVKAETPTEVEPKAVDATAKAPAKKSAKNKNSAKTAGEPTESTAPGAAGVITCKSGADTRIIENKDSGSGCEVVYTKNDQPTSIASANNDKSYCSAVADKVKNNLTAAGFNCQ